MLKPGSTFHLGTRPFEDPTIESFISKEINNVNFKDIKKFKYETWDKTVRHWLTSSEYSSINGLELFNYSAYSNGTSSAFTEFIARNSSRRIRYSNNEFVLSKIISNTCNIENEKLENDVINDNDAVIISLPFSGNGTEYNDFDDLISNCNLLNVPVMIDGAYFGISHNTSYNLTHPCITDFCTSLSKPYGLQSLRIGIRFTKEFIDDELHVQTSSNCYNKFGALLGVKVLDTYNHNWIVNRYYQTYLDICTENSLTPTNTLTLTTDNNNNPDFSKFKRGDYVRICVSDEIIRRLATN